MGKFDKKHIMPRTLPTATLLLLLANADALAQSSRVVVPYVNVSYTHESNIFRLSEPRPNESLSDSFVQTMAGLALEKEVGLQKFSGGFSLAHSNFSEKKNLDYISHDAHANWKWRLGSHVWGNIGGSTASSLTPYTEFHETARNLRLQKSGNADFVWLFHPSWRVRGGITANKTEYDLEQQKVNNRKQTQAELGFDYLPASGNVIGVVVRQSDDRFPIAEVLQTKNIINNNKTDEVKLRLDWKITGKTQVQVLAGMVRQKHQVFQQRDFQGANGRLTVTWVPTGKIDMVGVLWHEIAATENLTTNYEITNGLRLAPSMNISAKMRLEGLLRYEKRVPVGVQGISFNQVDKFSNATLKLTYMPLPKLQLKTSLSRDQLSSNLALRSYHANSVTFSAYYEY